MWSRPVTFGGGMGITNGRFAPVEDGVGVGVEEAAGLPEGVPLLLNGGSGS